MGMIANYQEITEEKVLQAQKDNSFFDMIEDEQEENEDLLICDIDKMWDALHFLLTGVSAVEPIEDNPISEAIVGQVNLSEEDDDFIAWITPQRVHEIAKALGAISFDEYIAKFEMKKFAKNEIYPSVWEYDDEEDEIIEDLTDCFIMLKEFYNKVSKKGCGVIVSIY